MVEPGLIQVFGIAMPRCVDDKCVTSGYEREYCTLSVHTHRDKCEVILEGKATVAILLERMRTEMS